MSIEAIGAVVGIGGLLVTLGLIIARASGRLVAVETRVGDLSDDMKEIRAQLTVRDQLTADVKELRSAIVSLSRPRQHIRESDGEILT